MSRILVLGGYGGFGSRISERLAESGHEVLVAGRNRERAERFCAGRPGLFPIALDRAHLAVALAEHRPSILVDAAGPFQGADYDVAQACIEAGVHYLDIADARDFVGGIAGLDNAAQAAGVAVISGASSVPALSGAVARQLAEGLDRVTAVDIAISASNRATAGAAVAAAMLSYAGKPIRLWRGQAWQRGYGWQDLRRETFEVAGIAPLRRRLIALCDVPDLDLLPERLAGRPAVTFRAGTELDVQNLTLWAATWPVRWRLAGSLTRLAPLIEPARRLTARLGGDRSAMRVRLFGVHGASRVERCWTLIADRGDGPRIPGLAVPLLVERILNGTLAPGARDAGTLLSLADFEPEFARLAIRHEIRESVQPPPLYERVMGERFARLPTILREMHEILRDGGASGRATVTRGRHPRARLAGWLVRFPPAGDHEVHVHFDERGGSETWRRNFSGHRFQSRLSKQGPFLVEHFGPLRFGFDLPSDESSLTMKLRRWWLGPLRLPLALAPACEAREWAEDDKFWFDVPVALPLVGLVAHYRGWLTAETKPPSDAPRPS